MNALRILALLALAGAGAAVATGAAAADWRGQEVTKDGVLQVMNPAEPSGAPVTIDLTERWRLGGDSEDEDQFFGVIQEVVTDVDGKVYLLDRQLHQVMIYTANGEFIRAIGREGEGPGEFRRPSGMMILPGGNIGVMQSMPGKIIVLTPEGDPADNFHFPGSEEGGTQMFFSCAATGDRVIVGVNQFANEDDGFRVIFELVGANAQGEKVATYYTSEQKQNMAKFEFDEKEIGGPAMQWDIGPDGRVYANTVFDGYRVDVWLPDGTPDRVIFKEYESRVRTDEEMEIAKDRFRVVVNGREAVNIVSKTDRDVQRIYPRQDGTLWVLSSRGALDAPEGTLGVFDVFDDQGRFLHQVMINGEGSIERDGYFFVGNRLYLVTELVSARRAMFGGHEGEDEEVEEEAEPIAVICYDLGPELHGMR